VHLRGANALGSGVALRVESPVRFRDVSTEIDAQARPEPPLEGDEAATVIGFLDYQRATLLWKTSRLGDEQLRIARPPSPITLGGLLKHLAYVEDYWFTEVVAERPVPEPWVGAPLEDDPDWDWHSAAADSGAALLAQWSASVERSRAAVAEALRNAPDAGLRATHPAWGGKARVSLRWVLVHMLEEYARHNGHADLLRESIDGETGE
jgi:uncharacterized damage-inducible protein DinB